ncbi:MAG TPA: CocE/NonD family hydrolase [Terriglobales bacterium]|nr:CocE/NonD family hydrolase [Terriglobales bacterium]
MFPSSHLLMRGRGPAAELRSARQPGAAVPTPLGVALTLLATLAVSSRLGALPAPKTPPALPSVHMVQQSIPMADGVRLAATLYMQDNTKPGEKFPALLEYLPYRKDDATAERDYPIHAWFAAHGYVSVRVDIRGFGASEGTPTDREYSEREQLDGEQVIAWLASQPWSTGAVGMFGISWGGFNSIQMAMRHPPALKAILAVDATEQLFHDDVHYIDGMMHFDEFELNMDLAPSMPGAPDYSLDEKILGPRFESAPWSLLYFKHQRDGEFWHAPVRPLREIKIPCFLIGGLLDGYRDSIPRMFEQVKAPVKAIVGPWNHTFPNDAEPGPPIEWRDQALRWWDYWLKHRNTGIMEEPPLSIYMQDWHAPDPHLKTVPGTWRGESGWPPRNVANTTLFLYDAHVLSTEPAKSASHQLRYIPSIGVESGFWWGELLTDQRPVDAFSLVYDSATLKTDLTMLGRPHALLQVSSSAPQADWFARLSDVAPDGTVTQVTGAGLNGAQRDSASDPKELVPNQTYPLDIEMHLASWTFPKGHRIRLAVSNALWPMVWPTPYAMTTTLQLGGDTGSRLMLPLVPPSMYAAPRFAPPQASEQRSDVQSAGYPWPGDWKTERDELNGKTKVTWSGKSEETYPWGKETDFEGITYTADDNHPESSGVQGEAEIAMALKEQTLIWQGHLTLTSDAQNFYYKYTRQLFKDGQPIKQKTWQETIPRDHQ